MKQKKYQQPMTIVVKLCQQTVLMTSGDGKGIEATHQNYVNENAVTWE